MNRYIFYFNARNGQYAITPTTPENYALASGTYFIAGQIVQVIRLEGEAFYSVEPRLADGEYEVSNV